MAKPGGLTKELRYGAVRMGGGWPGFPETRYTGSHEREHGGGNGRLGSVRPALGAPACAATHLAKRSLSWMLSSSMRLYLLPLGSSSSDLQHETQTG